MRTLCFMSIYLNVIFLAVVAGLVLNNQVKKHSVREHATQLYFELANTFQRQLERAEERSEAEVKIIAALLRFK